MELLLVEKHDVRRGEFRGFSIGMSRSAALQRMRALSVTVVKPIPHDQFVLTSDDFRSIEKLDLAPGARIRIDGGPEFELSFDHGTVSDVKTWKADGKAAFVEVGESVTSARRKIAELMASMKGVVVYAVVPHPRDAAVIVDDAGPSAEAVLGTFDAWRFEVPSETPAGAVYELFFLNDAVERISYRRARVRMD